MRRWWTRKARVRRWCLGSRRVSSHSSPTMAASKASSISEDEPASPSPGSSGPSPVLAAASPTSEGCVAEVLGCLLATLMKSWKVTKTCPDLQIHVLHVNKCHFEN